MSRDLLDENYYITSGGKIPVKWTAPEVYIPSTSVSIINLLLYFRQHITRNTQPKVMCGVMDVYCMRYGVWGVNHLRSYQISRYNVDHFEPCMMTCVSKGNGETGQRSQAFTSSRMFTHHVQADGQVLVGVSS